MTETPPAAFKSYFVDIDATRYVTKEDFDQQYLVALMRCLQVRRLKQLLVDHEIPLPDGYRLTSGETVDTQGKPVADSDWRKHHEELYERTKARFLEIGGVL